MREKASKRWAADFIKPIMFRKIFHSGTFGKKTLELRLVDEAGRSRGSELEGKVEKRMVFGTVGTWFCLGYLSIGFLSKIIQTVSTPFSEERLGFLSPFRN